MASSDGDSNASFNGDFENSGGGQDAPCEVADMPRDTEDSTRAESGVLRCDRVSRGQSIQ
jgi:hypothetical protein